MTLITKSISYRDGGTELTGVLALDDSSNKRRPGIFVVHGGAGLDEHAKSRAQQIAAQGFVTFACDMYGNGIAGDRQRVMARLRELTTDPTKLRRRVQAGLDILAAQQQTDGRFGAVGYCFGGLVVLELARSGAVISGVASIHGSLHTTRPAQLGAIKPKILVCHGALDRHVPMTQVTSFMDEMNRTGADWQFIVYGGALHGFTHESGPAIPGVGYHALSDQRSKIALRNFFAELFDQDAARQV
jgi:dienelactone hydrolase